MVRLENLDRVRETEGEPFETTLDGVLPLVRDKERPHVLEEGGAPLFRLEDPDNWMVRTERAVNLLLRGGKECLVCLSHDPPPFYSL